MVKKLLACVMMLLLTVSGAWAGARLEPEHYSSATLKGGKADYSEARFDHMDIAVEDTGLIVTEENMSLTGSLTIAGGNYSFWNGKELQKVSGTQQTFRLGLSSWSNIGGNAEFSPLSDSGSTLNPGLEADNGLNGVAMSWNFPAMSSLDGEFTMPTFLTTAEQLEKHVVYFEFVRSGENVTGINWRIVKASDTSTPVSLDYPANFYRFRIWNFDGERIYDFAPSFYIRPGQTPEGVLTFDSPIQESAIWRIMTMLITYDEECEKEYKWNYFTPTEPEMTLWNHHVSEASLVDGKSDYNTAKFSDIFFDVETANAVITDSRHFTNAGRITVPGGGYTLKDTETGETLSTVAAGTDMIFALKIYPNMQIGDTYLEYEAVDGEERVLEFAEDSESSLPGRTVTWTFPAELNMNGSGVIKNFKTTAQQLASGVPYVEVVSKDGYITALNYRIVKASDTATAITPGYRTDFNFRIYRTKKKIFDLPNSYNAGTARNTASGTLTLGIPQPLSTVKRIRVRLRSYEDSDNPAVYQWNFYPVEPEDLPVMITSEDLNPAATGQPYSHSLKASGDPTSWRVTSGVLPGGLTLSADGVISGTVSTDAIESNAESGKVYSFGITAENAARSDTKTFSITVYQPVRIITEALPNAKEGEEYYAEIEAEGTRDTFTQNVTSTIPPGLEYGTSETGKITLRGTPSIAGNYSVAAVFANRWSTVEKSFTLTVEGKPTSTAKPRITIPKTDDYLIAGKDYSFQFGTSGNAPVIWAVTGNTPAGLSFDASTGKLSGKAEATDEGKYSYSPMSYSFTVTATNSGGTDSANVYMKVYYPPEFAASSLPNATLNAGYKAEITAEGTEQGMAWTASSMNLPEGLTLTTSKNNRKCTITGVPHEIGTSSFSLKLSNTAGSTSEKVFILRVNEASSEETGKPTISTQSLYNGEISVQYVAFLEAAGRRPITWSRSGGKLPKGLTLDSYGAIKGVPTKAGTYNFTVTATNSEGSSSQNFTIVVTGDKYKKPKISTRKIPGATQNQPYSIQLACTGTNPVTWSLANSKQPSGIYVTEDGRITGIPKEAGKFKIKVKAENNIGTATRTFSLKVDGIAPKILTDDLPTGTKKVRYNAQLVADGTDPIKWSKSGSFPSGLKLNTKTGAITGKPRKANTYGFKITAKNKYGKYQKSFVIIVTDEAQETSSTTSAVTEPSTTIALDYSQEYSEPEIFPNHESEIDLYVVSGDEELRGEIYAPEGKPLTFKIGADAEDVEVYIADEAIAIDVEDDGTFILPGELVSDEFVIYAVSDGVKTIELYIVAEE